MYTSGLAARTPPHRKRAPDLTTDESQPVFAGNRLKTSGRTTAISPPTAPTPHKTYFLPSVTTSALLFI